ncbi:MAG: c-type cytochrome [Ramlibacter sp.]
MSPRLLAVAVASLALLAACDRKSETARAPASAPASAASAPASAASAASQPASSAAAPPLVPQEVAQASAGSAQDVQAGAQLAGQGSGAATACVGCHGANGEGNAQTGFPRLAGQGRLYLAHQLESYANGSRKNPVMQPIAAALNDAQRQQVAAYYASLGSAPSNAPPANAREPVLAGRGDDARQVQACANCHGPQGIGDAASNPYLAGQHANYLTATLAAWKSGDRNNDPSGQMPRIAKALTDDEVRTLVAYYAGLPAPAPRNGQAAPPALAASRPSVQSGPQAATTPAQGQGSEQGAPLTGGGQGQGAGGAATNQQQTPGTARP